MDLAKILDTAPEPAIVDAQTMGVSGDVSGDYWLPAPMCLYQKELSEQIVSLHYSDILKYYETEDYNTDVVLHSMQTMCLNSEYVATHPYLLIDHCVPKSLITKDIPNHLAETSGKFAVLKDLITLIQDYETETAIVCRSGRTMDLLEALLLGNRVNIKRYRGPSIKTKQKARKHSCTCHLFPSDGFDETSGLPVDPKIYFDLLLCLDPTVDTSMPHIQQILTQARPPSGPGKQAPIVRLTTINAIDHCELYHSKLLDPKSREYLVRVSAAVVVLRDVVGTLPPDLRPIYSQGLKYLVEWLEDPSIPWPLPDIYPIKTFTPMDVEKSLLTEVRFNQANENLAHVFNNGKKRGRKPNSAYSKEGEPISYYQSKRLKNDYSTNPLKQNMAQLTGIATINDGGSVNYHLSGGLLTHKLIQSIGEAYYNLDRQSAELQNFETKEQNQVHRLELVMKEHEDIKNQLEPAIKAQDYNREESTRLLTVIEEEHKKVASSMEELDTYTETLREKSPDFSKLIDCLLEIAKVQEEIEKQQKLKVSRNNEHTYMTEELRRANEALAGFQAEKAPIAEETQQLEQKIEEKLAEDRIQSQKSQERIQKLMAQINDEKAILETLDKQVASMTEQLKKTPPSKVRSSNNAQRGKHRKHSGNS